MVELKLYITCLETLTGRKFFIAVVHSLQLFNWIVIKYLIQYQAVYLLTAHYVNKNMMRLDVRIAYAGNCARHFDAVCSMLRSNYTGLSVSCC